MIVVDSDPRFFSHRRRIRPGSVPCRYGKIVPGTTEPGLLLWLQLFLSCQRVNTDWLQLHSIIKFGMCDSLLVSDVLNAVVIESPPLQESLSTDTQGGGEKNSGAAENHPKKRHRIIRENVKKIVKKIGKKIVHHVPVKRKRNDGDLTPPPLKRLDALSKENLVEALVHSVQQNAFLIKHHVQQQQQQ